MKIINLGLIGLSLLSLAASGHAETGLWNYASSQNHLRPTVGGTVSGLVGTLVLQNKEVPLTVGTDGIFAFQNTETRGDTYNVTVLMQPVSQICTVTNGAGKIINGSVTDISVQCINN